jgi:hypothetical protein
LHGGFVHDGNQVEQWVRTRRNPETDAEPTMLPSLLARDIQQGLKQFLVSGFEPADTFMHGLMGRFVEDESAWLKGPYVQMGLPFVTGSAGTQVLQFLRDRAPRLQPPGAGVEAAFQPAPGGQHAGGHGHGQWQDRVLPVPGDGPLRA